MLGIFENLKVRGFDMLSILEPGYLVKNTDFFTEFSKFLDNQKLCEKTQQKNGALPLMDTMPLNCRMLKFHVTRNILLQAVARGEAIPPLYKRINLNFTCTFVTKDMNSRKSFPFDHYSPFD